MATSDTQLNFEQLFTSLGVAYIVFDATDPDLTILEENQAHADVAMVRREDVIGKKLLDAFPDTSKRYKETGESDLVDSIRKVAKSGETDTMPAFSYDIQDTKGTFVKKFWEVSHSPVYEGDQVVAVIQQTRDVTDRVLAKKELARTQSQLQKALAYSAVGMWIWSDAKDVVTVDKNTADLFGFIGDANKEGVAKQDFLNEIHPGDVERVRIEIEQAIATRDPYESEYRVTSEKGVVRWLLVRGQAELDDDTGETKLSGIVVDITERKQAERNLHVLAEANTQIPASYGYRKTLNTITAKLVPEVADWCTIDLIEDGEITQVAVAHKDPEHLQWATDFRAQFAFANNEALGAPEKAIKSGEIHFIKDMTDEIMTRSAQTDAQREQLSEAGIVSVLTAPLKIDGEAIGAITFFSTNPRRHYRASDVEIAKGLANRAALAVYNANLFKEAKETNEALEARVKKRTEQLEILNDSLGRSNQELQDFAYVASHDLQEPLRKIRAFGDILQAEYGEGLGEDGREYLERMQNSATRMSTLIQDLLAFSRVTTRKQVTERIDLGKTVREVAVDLEWRIQELGGTLEIGELPVVNADQTHMRQLFQNLIGNALKFHKPEVAPVVKVGLVESESPDMYTIQVEDNGIGFDERYTDRIFSVFQRLHGRNEYEGTGIGLAVVRKIVERYGGTITATSTQNVGSTFIVSFPKAFKET